MCGTGIGMNKPRLPEGSGVSIRQCRKAWPTAMRNAVELVSQLKVDVTACRASAVQSG